MDELLDELLNIVDSGFAPAIGELRPENLVDSYYMRLYNVIKDAQEKRDSNNAAQPQHQADTRF